MADLRDKRDKAQRVLDRLVEEAVKKKVVYEEACAKVNTQREEYEDLWVASGGCAGAGATCDSASLFSQ